MRAALSIGEFATLTHLSIRTLRRYHEAGLLEPATVDPSSGYRYYDSKQIPSAQVIHRLRELDVPLTEVKAIIATDDAGRRADLIAGHLQRLEDQLDRTRAAVTSLQQLLRPNLEHFQVELRSVPARTVAAVHDVVDFEGVLGWFDAAMATLDGAFVEAERTGPPGGQYANELFTEGRGSMTLFRPVREPHASGRIEVTELPAVELAVTVHRGSHDDIDVTYGRLGAWVVEQALAVDGPIHETYLVGPRDTEEPSEWRTEIGWPIFRIARVSS
ncbi:MAG TPA: MerR family transcriptional regulator [Frankiaceae bacterium]|nr:MerR family transcriptional regulator [Frankiaceae bacterium]